MKAEKGRIEFATFIKSLHQHMITSLTNPKDITVAITEFLDPIAHMVPSLPTRKSVQQKLGLYPEGPTANESAVNKASREERNEEQADTIRELQRAEMKIYADRQKVVVNNLTVLWGIIIGQCTPALQEELPAEEDYEAKAAEYDSI